MIALVTNLTRAKLKILEAAGNYDGVGFIRSSGSPKSASLKLVQFNFKDAPPCYLEFLKIVHAWTEKIFRGGILSAVKRQAAVFGLPENHFINAAKKAAALTLADDGKLFVLGEKLFADRPRAYFVKEHELLKGLLTDPEIQVHPDADGARAFKLKAKFGVYWLIVLSKILLPAPKKSTTRPALIFDQFYDTLVNPDFEAFYRYFKTRDDVLYNCTGPRSKIYKLLNEAGKPVVVHRWGVSGIFRKMIEAARLVRFSFAGGLPPSFKFEILKLLRHRLYYESLFNTYRPALYLKVRADMEAPHPIATAVAEKYGVKNIGYSCGSYPFMNFYYAWLDFHHYGLLGKCFRTIFNGAWPDSIRYHLMGPLTVEIKNPQTLPPRRPLTIAAFSTSTSEDFYLQESDHRAFIENVCAAAESVKAKVIFKEKGLEPAINAFIEARCEGRVDYQILTHESHGTRAQEIIEEADIVCAMSCSSVNWEALSRRKKMVVHELPWVPNLFEGYKPQLVAKSAHDFQTIFDYLVRTPQNEYEDATASLLAACGKASDGNLVGDFIKSIENE